MATPLRANGVYWPLSLTGIWAAYLEVAVRGGWKLPAHPLSCSKEERVENYFYFLMLRIREYFWFGSADSYRVPLTNGSGSGSGFPAYKKIMMEACAVIPVPYRCNNFIYLLHAPIRAMFNEFSAIPFSVYLTTGMPMCSVVYPDSNHFAQ